jgi:hypothetical protein
MVLKCLECGSIFRNSSVRDGEVTTCPVCATNHTANVRDGKVQLEEAIYEGEDFGELMELNKRKR